MRIERECNKCVHRKENGCEKWDCEFEPYAPTREEALAILNTYDMSDDNEDMEFKSALALAIKTLEQEPILDKVRAGIKGKYRVVLKDTSKDDWAIRWNDCIDEVLQTIDKCRTETERKG